MAVKWAPHCIALAILFASGALKAQSLPQSSIPDPLRVEDSLRSPPEPVAAPAKAAIPKNDTPDNNTRQLRFVFRELKIEGSSALPESDLRSLWEHASGTEISVADVFFYADRVTNAYAKNGYTFSFAVVPQQEINNGVVTIRVVEGFVEGFNYEGAPFPRGLFNGAQRVVAAHMDRMIAQRPATARRLERTLLLINDIPGIAARATFAPGTHDIGGSRLTLNVDPKRISGEIGYNSYMPPALGRQVVGGSIAVSNLVTGVDRIRLSGWHSIQNAAYRNASVDYFTLLGADGLSISASASYGRMRPVSALLRAIDYQGTALSGNLNVRYPLVRSRRDNLAFEVGVSMVNTDAAYLAGPLLRDRLRASDLALTWESTDALGAASVVRLELSQGLDLPGTGGDSRAFGINNFTIANISAQRLQPVTAALGGQIDVLMSGFGQRSLRGSLFSSVECSYGGRRFGRRFDAGELSGDHCALGGLELRWGRSGETDGQLVLVQLYSFVDGAIVRQQGSLIPGERREQRLASAGAGIRFDLEKGLLGNLELSLPVRRPVGSIGGNTLRITGGMTVKF